MALDLALPAAPGAAAGIGAALVLALAWVWVLPVRQLGALGAGVVAGVIQAGAMQLGMEAMEAGTAAGADVRACVGSGQASVSALFL